MWFTQKQMAELFGKDRRTITRHIQNIYKDEELSESSVYSFFEHTAEEGIEPNNFMFARNLAGKKAVFLIQNMFPTLEKYIEQEYKKAGISIKVPKAVKEEKTEQSKKENKVKYGRKKKKD